VTDHVLTDPFEQMRGVVGRYPAPDERYIFEFDTVEKRGVHMFGVFRPLTVEFYLDGELVKQRKLLPFIGRATAICDRVIERRPT